MSNYTSGMSRDLQKEKQVPCWSLGTSKLNPRPSDCAGEGSSTVGGAVGQDECVVSWVWVLPGISFPTVHPGNSLFGLLLRTGANSSFKVKKNSTFYLFGYTES